MLRSMQKLNIVILIMGIWTGYKVLFSFTVPIRRYSDGYSQDYKRVLKGKINARRRCAEGKTSDIAKTCSERKNSRRSRRETEDLKK